LLFLLLSSAINSEPVGARKRAHRTDPALDNARI
jgi:hypothetical protein